MTTRMVFAIFGLASAANVGCTHEDILEIILQMGRVRRFPCRVGSRQDSGVRVRREAVLDPLDFAPPPLYRHTTE